MAEIWVLNEEPIFSQEYLSFNAVFTTDNIEMDRIEIEIEHIPEIPGSSIKKILYTQKILSGMVPNIYTAYDSSTRGWDKTAYRTLVFETAPTGDLLTWLQANGTKQVTSKKLTKLKYKASDVCQLLDKSKYPATKTSNGITFTNNDGVIIVNGTATTTASYSITDVGVSVIGHKYLLAGGVNSSCYIDGYISYGISDVHFGNDGGTGHIFTANVSGMMRILLRVVTNYAATNVMFKPQLFDLTEMYGAGNEPTTLAEFRQKYPNDLYPYSPQCWYSINKTRYITPTKNLFNIGISTDWQTPVNNSYNYVPFFIGIGKTCTISWDLDYYKAHLAPYSSYICVNNGQQPSTSNRTWLWHQTDPSLQNSQVTVSANSTGYIYFECAVSSYLNYPYIFNENLKWQLELGNQKTDYVPHGYLPLNKGVKL